MNPTYIDWPYLTHTLNPVTGCLRGCSYCYARILHERRHKAYMDGANISERYKYPFNDIHYWPRTFDTVPRKPKKPIKIWIGSVSEIAYWEDSFLEKTIDFCADHSNIDFMFLTKDPHVYLRHTFPLNCQLGLTITNSDDFKHYNDFINLHLRNYTFLSIEPLLGFIGGIISRQIDLVIVGMQTKPALMPKREWIESIEHPNIHIKYPLSRYIQLWGN